MQCKTIEELNQKAWYRLLKVVYGLSFVFFSVKSLIFVTEEFLKNEYVMLGCVLYILYPIFIYTALEFTRRLFFYVMLGTMKPPDDTYFIKLKKHKKDIAIAATIIIVALAIGIWEAHEIYNIKQLEGPRPRKVQL